jgi:hypothetical protein
MLQSAIKAESQDLSPLNVRKRVADSTFPRKQRRHSSSASQIQGGSQAASQEMYRKRPRTLTTISRKLAIDTIQYLQTLSDRILISDTIFPREWATMHLATQLLQSRYEDTIARKRWNRTPRLRVLSHRNSQKRSARRVLLRMRRSCMIERLLVLITLLAIFLT